MPHTANIAQPRRLQSLMPIRSLANGFALGALGTALAVVCVAGLYLAKSAMGINLFPGHSPLHDVLFHLVS